MNILALANQLGLATGVIDAKLSELGIFVPNHETELNGSTSRRLKDALAVEILKAKTKKEAAAKPTGGKNTEGGDGDGEIPNPEGEDEGESEGEEGMLAPGQGEGNGEESMAEQFELEEDSNGEDSDGGEGEPDLPVIYLNFYANVEDVRISIVNALDTDVETLDLFGETWPGPEELGYTVKDITEFEFKFADQKDGPLPLGFINPETGFVTLDEDLRIGDVIAGYGWWHRIESLDNTDDVPVTFISKRGFIVGLAIPIAKVQPYFWKFNSDREARDFAGHYAE